MPYDSIKELVIRLTNVQAMYATYPELIRLLQHHRVFRNTNYGACGRSNVFETDAFHARATGILIHASLAQLIPEAHSAGIELLLNMGYQ